MTRQQTLLGKSMINFLLLLVLGIILTSTVYSLAITSAHPEDRIGTTNITLKVTTDSAGSCKYDLVDKSHEDMANNFTTTGSLTHTQDLTLIEGNHTYYAKCEKEGDETDASQIQFFIDTTNVSVTGYSPSTYVLESFTLFNISTDENATCKYGTSSGTAYTSMTSFDSTGQEDHNVSLVNLNEGDHNYYVICKDAVDLLSEEYTALVRVDYAPIGNILLDTNKPLGKGEHEIKFLLNEELQDSPELTFTNNETDTTTVLHLTGSGKEWKGTLSVNDSMSGKYVFNFSGKDLRGTTSHAIKNATFFKVDTTPPEIPTGITLERQPDGDVELYWDESNESIPYYIIYRSRESGVDKSNYYENTSNNDHYVDREARRGTSYFYKIRALDLAGNEGELSEEFHAPSLSLADLESFDEDFNQTNSDEKETEETTEEVEEELSFEERKSNFITLLQETITQLAQAKTQLDNADPLVHEHTDALQEWEQGKTLLEENLAKLQEEDSEAVLITAELALEQARTIAPKEVSVQEASHTLGMDQETVRAAVQEWYTKQGKNASNKSIQKAVRATNTTNITVTAKLLTLTYLDDSQKHITHVTVTFPEKQETILAVLPGGPSKESTILFTSGAYLTDGIAVWTDQETLSYLVKDNIFDQTSNAHIVLSTSGMFNFITGFTVQNVTSKNSGYAVLAILSLLLVGGLGYYFYNRTVLTSVQQVRPKSQAHQQAPLQEIPDIQVQQPATPAQQPIQYASQSQYGINLVPSPQKTQSFPQPPVQQKSVASKGKEVGKSILHAGVAIKDKLFYHAKNLELDKLWEIKQQEEEYNEDYYYPNYASVEYQKHGLTHLQDTNVFTLLTRAHQSIDDNKLNAASKMYHMLISHYDIIERMSAERQATLNRSLVSLYHKLTLALRVKQAKNCHKMEDYANLRYLLNDIATYYNKVAEELSGETELVNQAKYAHGKYSSALIERGRGQIE